MAVVRWRDWEGHGLEHCVYRKDAEGFVLDGVVVGAREGAYGGHYFVRADSSFRTREVRVEYVDGPRLHVACDGNGDWWNLIENRALPELLGCIDVDIGITPATNTLPIKRLGLQASETRDIAVAYIPLPGQIDDHFLPRRTDQRYTCLWPDHRYRYESLVSAFKAELEIDELGLVLDYPETFRRIYLPA